MHVVDLIRKKRDGGVADGCRDSLSSRRSSDKFHS